MVGVVVSLTSGNERAGFAVAGALTAVGGLLLAPTVPVTFNSGLAITINGFAAAVFGDTARTLSYEA